jgi:hypothetical protein
MPLFGYQDVTFPDQLSPTMITISTSTSPTGQSITIKIHQSLEDPERDELNTAIYALFSNSGWGSAVHRSPNEMKFRKKYWWWWS